MISDRALVLAAAATYDAANTPIIEALAHSIRVFWSKIDGLTVIGVEGTHNRPGWALDFLAIATPDQGTFDHPSLGMLHAGIHFATMAVLPRIAMMVQGGDYGLTGHSLGAAVALDLGAHLAIAGHPPVQIGAFAPPRVGGEKFVKALSAIPICAVRYGNDPVPMVPLWLPEFPYQQVPLRSVGAAMLNPFKCHHIANYVGAFPALEAA